MPNSKKQYTLMHKNVPTADIELDEATCTISAIGPVCEASHIPVGTPVKKGVIDRAALNDWWKRRAIPASRLGIKNALPKGRFSFTRRFTIPVEYDIIM